LTNLVQFGTYPGPIQDEAGTPSLPSEKPYFTGISKCNKPALQPNQPIRELFSVEREKEHQLNQGKTAI
jgi:hypothetical protein